jgi:hypothetical protein
MSGVRGHSRHAAVHRALIGVAVLLLAGCSVQLKPEYQIPKPLLKPMNARVGLVLDEPLRTFAHEETRGGANWKVELGAGHDKLFRSMFGSSFQSLQVFNDLDAARAAGGVQVLFEPAIEQYSFVTANETSGFWAVTIRYRIDVLDPAGNALDSFTLTGYGSAAGVHGSEASLTAATRAAMRDAASKFLVQMPRQELAQKLMAGKVLTAADKTVEQVDVVEVVPIEPQSGG